MSGPSAIVAELTSTLQSLSINQHPDPSLDLNPSTSSSTFQPVHISHSPNLAASLDDLDADEIPGPVLQPVRRKTTLPPLPDLRFEQSYLASIRGAREEGRVGRVAWITVRDQIFLPLIQGLLWSLILSGWRHWHATASFSGTTAGARIRRWWWGVNNWRIPARDPKTAEDVKEVSTAAWVT